MKRSINKEESVKIDVIKEESVKNNVIKEERVKNMVCVFDQSRPGEAFSIKVRGVVPVGKEVSLIIRLHSTSNRGKQFSC